MFSLISPKLLFVVFLAGIQLLINHYCVVCHQIHVFNLCVVFFCVPCMGRRRRACGDNICVRVSPLIYDYHNVLYRAVLKFRARNRYFLINLLIEYSIV